MELDKNCSNCSQKHDCKSIYEAMGNAKGKSVAMKVIVVFLLPILVFIASLVACEKLFQGVFEHENAKTAISALISAIVCFIYILIAKAISNKLSIREHLIDCKDEK